MKFEKLAQLRYSVRRFDARPIEKNKEETILKAAAAAPSAKDKQSWRLLAIRDKNGLERLNECTPCHYYPTLAFIMCADPATQFVRKQDGLGSAVIDAAIAETHMMLQACELGIGSTWIMNFDPDKVKEIYHIPEGLIPISILVCGYPRVDSQIDPRHMKRLPVEELVRYDDFAKENEHE